MKKIEEQMTEWKSRMGNTSTGRDQDGMGKKCHARFTETGSKGLGGWVDVRAEEDGEMGNGSEAAGMDECLGWELAEEVTIHRNRKHRIGN